MLPKHPGTLRLWLAASRPRTLPAAAAPVLAASALAWHDGVFAPAPACICLLFALLIQIGANFANDYSDGIRGTDAGRKLGPARAVASGWVTPRTMRTATGVVLGLAVAVGLILIGYGGGWLLVVGVASVVFALAYTGGPYPLGYHGLGDVFVIVFFGLVASAFTFYVQAGYFSTASLWIGMGLGFITNNLLVVNNHRDMDEDRGAGKRTLIVRFGRGFGNAQYLCALAVGLLSAVVLTGFLNYPRGVLLTFLPLCGGFYLWLRLRRATTRADYSRLLSGSSGVVLAYALCLVIGFALSR